MKTSIYAALLSVGICTTTAAQIGTPYGPYGYGQSPGPHVSPRAMPDRSRFAFAEANSPDQQLRDGVNKLLGFMRREQAPSPAELASFLDSEIAPFFDFAHMTKVASGRMYRVMDEDRQAKLAESLKQRFLGKLAERLGNFDNQDVKFLASRVNRDGRTGKASLAVIQPKGYPARIEFRFYRQDGDWKVYDVVANGQSAVAHYRRELRQTMRGRPSRPGSAPGTRMRPHPRINGYR